MVNNLPRLITLTLRKSTSLMIYSYLTTFNPTERFREIELVRERGGFERRHKFVITKTSTKLTRHDHGNH